MGVITTLTILLAFYLQVTLIRKLSNESPLLVAALILFLNAILFVWVTFQFNKIIDKGQLDDFTSMDKIINLNRISGQTRNSVVTVSLVLLAYGLYSQYRISKRIAFVIVASVVGTVAVLVFWVSLLSGAFII